MQWKDKRIVYQVVSQIRIVMDIYSTDVKKFWQIQTLLLLQKCCKKGHTLPPSADFLTIYKMNQTSLKEEMTRMTFK
jgi:hypothetical protein